MSPSQPQAPGTTIEEESFGKIERSSRLGPRLIKAHKTGWPRFAVHTLIRSKLRSGLHAIHVQGLTNLRQELKRDSSAILLLANHSSWWDFFIAHWMNVSIPIDGYGMTDHSNLLKFGFFRRIGAFSVDRNDPASIRASINYTAELLSAPGRGVWLFPQGKIECNDVRPLKFQHGLRVLLQRAGRLRIVPTALRYDFWQDERPEAFIRFGTPVWVGKDQKKDLIETWQRALTGELDQLRSDSLTQDASRFETIFRGKNSSHDRYHEIKTRIAGQRFNPR